MSTTTFTSTFTSCKGVGTVDHIRSKARRCVSFSPANISSEGVLETSTGRASSNDSVHRMYLVFLRLRLCKYQSINREGPAAIRMLGCNNKVLRLTRCNGILVSPASHMTSRGNFRQIWLLNNCRAIDVLDADDYPRNAVLCPSSVPPYSTATYLSILVFYLLTPSSTQATKS